MKLRDYLMNISTDELTERLKYLDKTIQELHSNGYYVVGDLADIEIINNEVTLESFKDKIDYLNSGINENGKNKDVLELCSIGICAYNKLSVLHTSKEFIEYVIENVEMFLEHGNIPSVMQEYYIDVFNRGKIDYLNSFISKNMETDSSARDNSRGAYVKATPAGRTYKEELENNNIIDLASYRNKKVANNLWVPYTDSTAVGKALSKNKNAAYASVLLLPALLALIYIVTVVVYFIFIK